MDNSVYQFIEEQEGKELNSYRDSAGIWTIGIGSITYKDGRHVQAGETITEADAEDLMKWEVDNKAAAIRGLTSPISLNDSQTVALVSFVYNLGVGAFANSTLLKKIKINPSDPAIRDEFAKWNKIHVDGKLKVSGGLTARRKREADLYFS